MKKGMVYCITFIFYLILASFLVNSQALSPDDPQCFSEKVFVRGNTNMDNKVDITDPIVILEYLFQGGSKPVCVKNADADGNDKMECTMDGLSFKVEKSDKFYETKKTVTPPTSCNCKELKKTGDSWEQIGNEWNC